MFNILLNESASALRPCWNCGIWFILLRNPFIHSLYPLRCSEDPEATTADPIAAIEASWSSNIRFSETRTEMTSCHEAERTLVLASC
jgi:hypothetical protein